MNLSPKEKYEELLATKFKFIGIIFLAALIFLFHFYSIFSWIHCARYQEACQMKSIGTSLPNIERLLDFMSLPAGCSLPCQLSTVIQDLYFFKLVILC